MSLVQPQPDIQSNMTSSARIHVSYTNSSLHIPSISDYFLENLVADDANEKSLSELTDIVSGFSISAGME